MNQLLHTEQLMMVTKSDTKLGRVLADGLLQRYMDWRHESDAVELAYDAWIRSDKSHRELTYAGYLAALDQEELAAEGYREQVEWVGRISG